MKTYARIQNDSVVEIVTTQLNADGADIPIADLYHPDFVATLVDISGVEPAPQDGWAYLDGVFAAPVAPVATPAQRAATAMAGGLAITSTGTPALNGTYAVDQLSQAHIVAIETSINANKGFPGGSTTFAYPDAAGAMHTFSEADFTAFAAAVRDYVWALNSVIGGASSTLPAATTTIA